MKLLAALIFGFLVVQTLGYKNPSRRSGPPSQPQGPPPRRPHRPPGPPAPGPPQKREDDKEKGLGWGWGGPPTYETFSCVNPDSIVTAPIDMDFDSRTRLWYVTGDTKYYYNTNARIFLGRNAQSQEELNQMCWAQIFSSSDPVQINSGFGVQFTQNVVVSNDGVWTVPTNTDPSTYDSGVDIFAGFVTHQGYLVATDNKTYEIYYICVDGLHATIELTTTRPYASPEAVGVFVEMAKKYGISLDQLQLAQCDSAYHGPYPAPFENYPNGWSSGNGWSNNSTGWGSAPSNGWSQSSSNGWNSNPQPSGWNSQPNGWSNNHNNGWLAEKQAEEKKESEKVAEPKSDSKKN